MEKKQIENEALTKVLPIMEYLGRTFIKTPRSIFRRMQSDDIMDRQVAHLHLLLFGICFHTDGFCTLKKKIVACRRGEFVGKQSMLAKMMNVSDSTLGRLLNSMEKQELVSVRHINGGTRIYLHGYDEFTFVPVEPETDGKKKSAMPPMKVANQLQAAEDKIGGRSMQNLTDQPN